MRLCETGPTKINMIDLITGIGYSDNTEYHI